ncbi:hypothetical protein ABIA69_001910 [Lysinibacillus parviboronicapiens]|uniref:Transglycosylase n=1 Tax=Lysinibacillus parviboronicapiens TaxID=436516 RepID=A0ABV2PJ35_9BACI
MTNVIVCDDCQKEIIVSVKDYEYPAHQLKGYVIETYFRCQHCDKKYSVIVTDKQARKMQKEIRRFHQQIIKGNYKGLTEEEYKEKIDEQYAVMEGMKQQLKIRTDELKAQVMQHEQTT